MAEMTIRLQIDPATNKKNIVISLSGDADSLPHEHEQQHRALVDKLIQGGIVKASELGQIIVERDRPEKQPVSPLSAQGETERQGRVVGDS